MGCSASSDVDAVQTPNPRSPCPTTTTTTPITNPTSSQVQHQHGHTDATVRPRHARYLEGAANSKKPDPSDTHDRQCEERDESATPDPNDALSSTRAQRNFGTNTGERESAHGTPKLTSTPGAVHNNGRIKSPISAVPAGRADDGGADASPHFVFPAGDRMENSASASSIIMARVSRCPSSNEIVYSLCESSSNNSTDPIVAMLQASASASASLPVPLLPPAMAPVMPKPAAARAACASLGPTSGTAPPRVDDAAVLAEWFDEPDVLARQAAVVADDAYKSTTTCEVNNGSTDFDSKEQEYDDTVSSCSSTTTSECLIDDDATWTVPSTVPRLKWSRAAPARRE